MIELLLEEMKNALANSEYKRVCQLALNVLNLEKDNIQALRLRAQARLHLALFERAEDDATFVILHSGDADGKMHETRLMALTCRDKPDYKRAIDDADYVLTLEPNHLISLKAKVIYFHLTQQFVKGLEVSNQLVNFFPEKAIGYAYRAHMLYHLSHQKEALLDAEKALQLDLNNYLALMVRARINVFSKKKFTTVIEDATFATKINPGISEPWLLKGLAFHHMNYPRQAFLALNKAWELEPNSTIINKILADFHLKYDALQSALMYADKLVSIKKTKHAFKTRMEIHAKLNNIKEAGWDADTAIDKGLDEVDTRLNRAKWYFQEKYYGLLKSDIEFLETHYKDSDPKIYTFIYLAKATIEFENKSYNKAESFCMQSLGYDDDNTEARMLHANIKRAQGSNDIAISIERTAYATKEKGNLARNSSLKEMTKFFIINNEKAVAAVGLTNFNSNYPFNNYSNLKKSLNEIHLTEKTWIGKGLFAAIGRKEKRQMEDSIENANPSKRQRTG